MKRFWLRSLALSLGLAVAGARGQTVWAEEPIARSSATPTPPAAVLGRPVAIATSNPTQPSAAQPASTPAAPAATLGRPVAVASSPEVRQDAVQRVSFTAGREP